MISRFICILVAVGLIISAEGSVCAQTAADNLNSYVADALDHTEQAIDTSSTTSPAGQREPQTVDWGEHDRFGLSVEPVIKTETGTAHEPVSITAGQTPEPLRTEIIPLLYAEAESILETLEGMKGPEGIIEFNEKDRTLTLKDEPARVEEMSAYVKKVDILLETDIFEIQHVHARDIYDRVRAGITENIGQAKLDEDANTIIVTDTPTTIGNIKDIIQQLDQVDKKVQLSTKILRIILNEEYTAGVDWEAIVSDYQNMDFPGLAVGGDADVNNRLNVGVISEEDYPILLEALDTVGVLKTLSDDSKTVEHEERDTVKILPAAWQDWPEFPAASGPGDNQEQPRGFSSDIVEIHLTPSVKRDDSLLIELEPELVRSGGGYAPETKHSNLDMNVQNGATIVIGSLFEEVVVESMWKVPLLGDLPFLGFVFRNQGEEARKAEVITFLTVRTIEKE